MQVLFVVCWGLYWDSCQTSHTILPGPYDCKELVNCLLHICTCIGVDVVVATPGRLLQLEDMGTVSLNTVSYLVVDEADRFMQGVMEEEIRKVQYSGDR